MKFINTPHLAQNFPTRVKETEILNSEPEVLKRVTFESLPFFNGTMQLQSSSLYQLYVKENNNGNQNNWVVEIRKYVMQFSWARAFEFESLQSSLALLYFDWPYSFPNAPDIWNRIEFLLYQLNVQIELQPGVWFEKDSDVNSILSQKRYKHRQT